MTHPGRGAPALRWWLLLALWLLLAVAIALVTSVLVTRAEEEEVDQPRHAPSSRGTRATVLERAEVEDLVAAAFPPEEVERAMSVLFCESRFDPGATGRLGERGLAQLHPIWQPLADRLYWPGVSLYDPEVNVAVAAALWRQAGWAPWSCRPW